MDAERFDRVVRFLGRPRSRRGVLGLFAGAIGAGAIPLAAGAAFRPRPDGAVCIKNADCASSNCAPKNSSGRRLCGPADPCAGVTGPEGAMACAGTGFCTIANGAGVYRDCAPSTICRELDPGEIVCDRPT